jgi:hypothetical protein
MELQEGAESKEKTRNKILTGMLSLSDQQFDPVAKEQVKKLIGLSNEDVRKPLVSLLDDCVRFSLCSLRSMFLI